MRPLTILSLWCRRALECSLVLLVLSGCGGGGGNGGQEPPPPPGTSPSATELNITIDSVTITSPPVVEFTVTNEDGLGFPGLKDGDLRFNIAKLIPGIPTRWQDYIVRANDDAMQGFQERCSQDPGEDPCSKYTWGKLKNNDNGKYIYTFETDITNAPCPAPCTDADGNALDVSYQPGLTHRVSIQQGNRDLPLANAVFDFVPAGGPVTSSREIVRTANCNECHDKITAHGSRFEMKLCVTCHNPGSWVKNDDGTTTTVDFKVMIHKIHRSPELTVDDVEGVKLPHNDYAVGDHDFSDIVFPQDTRNCTKCHDGDDPETPQGNNWQDFPSREACGSCHDDIDFDKDGSGTPAHEPGGHSGGSGYDNSQCTTCHRQGGFAGSVEEKHIIPGKVERDCFKFNILEICGKTVGSETDPPKCAPGVSPTVKFSVVDPACPTHHQYYDADPAADPGADPGTVINAYNIKSDSSDMEFSSGDASLNLLIAWDTRDYTNEGGTGSRPSRAGSVSLRTSAAVTDHGDGTFTLNGALVTPPIMVPDDPDDPKGTGAVALEGHPVANDGAGDTEVAVNSEVAYFAITDEMPKPRRKVVDVPTKCDRCHDFLSVHGNARNNNGQLCVLCHNPSGTDVARRPKDAVTGLPLVSPLDGKTEESIDFKRLIHGIHAAAETNFDGTNAHGFREKGLVIYGFGGSPNDFSKVRFPGVLSKCETCHLPDTYTLADRSASGGNWELPAQNGIRGSTVDSYPGAAADGSDFAAKLTDQSDDLKYSPIASVCSACHDGTLPREHMEDNGALFGADQATQEGNVESCPVCHGPGRLADVKLVHDEAFAEFLGEFIP